MDVPSEAVHTRERNMANVELKGTKEKPVEVNFRAPGKMIDRQITISKDGSTTAVITYDEGTVVTVTMTAEGVPSIHVNKSVALDPVTGELTVVVTH